MTRSYWKSADAALSRAKAADLVTLPPALQKGDGGTRCANCQFVRQGEDYCDHEKVDQPLPDGAPAMCCALWDAPGTKRAWEE